MRKIIRMALCVMMLTGAVTGCAGIKPASDSGESSEIVEIVEVEIPQLAKDQILVMDAVGLAVKAHADAMIWTEKLSRAAENDSLSEEAKMEVLDNCIEAWRIADTVSKKAESMADLLFQAEELPEYQYTTAALIKEDSDGNLYSSIKGSLADSIDDLFFVKVYAAGNTKIDAKTWAENITKAYDEGKNGQKLKNIANMMGLNGDDKEDCKKAYKALQTAQGIMKGTYEGEQAEKEAATWDNIYKTAKVLKTSGKVAGFAAGFLSLGATTGLTGALELGGVAVDGIDATLEVMDTGAMLILGDNNSVSVKAQDLGSKLAPVSSVLSAANAGKTLIGLDWSGGLSAINKGLSDSNGYGIISFLGNGIADYLDDKKLVGGAIKKGNDGSFKCNLVQIYSNAKPEEKEKIKEQLKEAGFKDEAITEILKPASAATDESTLISFEELTPEQIDEISIITDVIREENNPEKTVGDLAEEMQKILGDSYEIVAAGDEKVQEKEKEESAEASSGKKGQGLDIEDLLGDYQGTCTQTRYYGTLQGSGQWSDSETSTSKVEDAWVYDKDGKPVPRNFGYGQGFEKDSITYDPASSSGSAYSLYSNGKRYDFTWYFVEDGDTIRLFMDAVEHYSDSDTIEGKYHYELVRI